MSGEFWYIFFLAVVLKIPIVGMCLLIWWAVRNTGEPEPQWEDGEGFRRNLPPTPRPRGPHGSPTLVLPDCPPGGRARTALKPARAGQRPHIASPGGERIR